MWQYLRVRLSLRDSYWLALLVCCCSTARSAAARGETRHVLVLSSSELAVRAAIRVCRYARARS